MVYKIDVLKNLMYLDILDGYHTVVTTANKQEVSIDVEIYNFYDDVDYYDVDKLGDSTPDQRMLIVKYHKNLTIHEGAWFRPQVRKKGMLLLCLGTITNSGYISMTARGAIAAGQNVYLYTNSDGTYEYIPATGGTGAASAVAHAVATGNNTAGSYVNGNTPPTPGFRKLGGGGSGAAGTWRNYYYNGHAISGKGGDATSYSGGAGSGGVRVDLNYYGDYATNNVSNIDFKGTDGLAIQANGGSLTAGGGAGYPGGTGKQSDQYSGQYVNHGYDGDIGTGGLLIIFTQVLINKGYIESKGSAGGGGSSGGGGSGGGSINIFCKTYYSDYDSSLTAVGGASKNNGGSGATGSITTMKNLNLIAMFMIQQGDNIYTLKESQYVDFPTVLEDLHIFKSASDGIPLKYDEIMNNATSNISTLVKAITLFKNASVNNIKILKYKN